MKSAITSFLALVMVLFFGAWQAKAATITAGPTGQYASPCLAFPHMADGDTLLVDANGGVPYYTGGCNETANYATITGVNGRPIIDPGTNTVYNALWEVHGHDVVIDNMEFRNTGPAPSGSNSPGIWMKAGTASAPGGANLTVEQSYFYNNKMGLLTDNVGFGGYTAYAWYSPNPYITLQYDEFSSSALESADLSHNIYISGGGNMTLNLQYSFTHDNRGGHELKSRALHSNVYYNFIGDLLGVSDFVMDFPLGGDTYVVGNVIYKADINPTLCTYGCNGAFIVYRSRTDNQVSGSYPEPYNDLHFVNNTAIDGENNVDPGNLLALVNLACYDDGLTTEECPAPATVSGGLPGNGGALTTPAVFENNIFVGPTSSLEITNQTEAVLHGNILLDNNSTNLADLFVDAADLDFHLASGSPAIGAGIYPPTDNQGNADPLVLATNEYVHPLSGVARPTPSGSTMDAGAYSYPRVGTPPTLQLAYSNTITAPNSGTITVSGMPTPPSGQSSPVPPAGQFNTVQFVSGNTSVIPYIETAETTTGSVTVTYLTSPVAATVTVPIDIYANGAHATATITVNPGPPILYSLTKAGSTYVATDTVNLEGPAPAGGLVVNLSSSDPTVLYTPATVTVPAGQISATVNSLATNFFTPSPVTETLTATAAGVTQTLTRAVYSPKFTGADCGSCTVVGGQPGEIYSDISYGPAPENGAGVTITSNNTAAIPNQTVPVAPGETDFPHSAFNITTNAVSTTTTVTITANFGPYSSSTATFTVNPGGPAPASIAAVSGSGQTAAVGTSFTNPLIAVVKDSSGNPVSGVTVTFAGSNVSFPSGATATTNSSGDAQVTAQPTASGALTITATVAGVGTPASFSETGTAAAPASIAAVSGSGQTAAVGTSFTNPLIAVVKDSSGNPVSGVTVTFAGSNVSFPSGATATTNSSGDAQVTAQPTASGSLTITATVAGVGTPATFSETGTSAGGTLASITNLIPQNYDPVTLVNLTGNATSPVVVQLSSSDPSIVYVPATVTIPTGKSSVQTGSLLGSLWGQSPSTKTATLSATYNGVTVTLTRAFATVGISSMRCAQTGCPVTGGQPITYTAGLIGLVPYGGAPVQITSDTPAVIPNQTVTLAQGGNTVSVPVNTNAVSTTTTVQVTVNYNGSQYTIATTVNPGAAPASIAVVSGSGQTAGVGTNFASPLVVVVKDASSNPVSGATVTFAGTGVSFPSGATATTNSSGDAQVTVQPTATGALTVTATVAGVGTPASFSETGTAGPPSSVATVSGSGQTSAVGTNFTNPLVVVVKDSGGNPVSGVAVTFAGSNVSFPSGATATTNSSGDAQVTAQPTATGALTITASVACVGTPATFSETGTSTGGGTLASITNLIPQNYDPVTLVNLTANATSPVVVQLSSSDPSIVYVPATVTIPTGSASVRTGSLLGSLWGQSPSTKTATLSATYNGVTVTLTRVFATVGFNSFGCQTSCTVTGGQPVTYIAGLIGLVPYGGATVQITSDNPAVIPNQSFPLAQGANTASFPVSTNAVSTTTTVHVTANYNGSQYTIATTVNP